MNRTETIERLNQAVAQMDDATLEHLVNWAGFMAALGPVDTEGIQETITKNERELAEHRRQLREARLQALSLAEKRIWNKVQRGSQKAAQEPKLSLTMNEGDLLLELSSGPQLAVDAFHLGLEKGYAAAAKATKETK